MSTKTRTLNCHNCAGAIEVPGDTMRTPCPYCGDMVWAPMSTKNAGEATRRLMQILQTEFADQLQAVELRKNQAIQQADHNAYRETIEQEATLHAAAYDRIDYWNTFGVTRQDFLEQYVDQHMHSAQTIFAHVGAGGQTGSNAPSSAGDQQELERHRLAYTRALQKRDVHGFAAAWRGYMELTLKEGHGANLSEEQLEYQIRGSMENMLRDQDWVGKKELESLGFSTVYDARSTEPGLVGVDCQNCSAPLEAEPSAEFVECPYCDAITYLQKTMSQQSEAFQQGYTAQSDHSANAPSESRDSHYLQLAKNAVKSGYPDLELSSSRGRVLTHYFIHTMQSTVSPEEDRKIRQELQLGDGTITCNTCDTRLATTTPPIKRCALCQSSLSGGGSQHN